MVYRSIPSFLRDRESFLQRITSAGYRFLEPCLALSPIAELRDRVWLPEDFAENAQLLWKNGKHIWFISTRPGLMQCWRMNRDGSGQTQMAFRQRSNWPS